MIPTTEKLALALEEIGAPKELVTAAREGRYDDFKSESATPLMDLVRDLNAAAKRMSFFSKMRVNLREFTQRVKDGEFDASSEESQEWASQQTGEMADILNTLTPSKGEA